VLGIAIGGFVGVAVGRAMSGFLFGIGALDPVAFGDAIGLLLLVAPLATFVPARRASTSIP
jgi:hypothetical protein